MKQINFIYAIIETNKANMNGIKHTSQLRFNNDKTKFIFKTYKENSNLRNVPLYSKEKIKKILQKEEWRTNLNINQ